MEQLPPLERHFHYIQIDSPTASHTPVKMRDLIVFGQLVSLWLWGTIRRLAIVYAYIETVNFASLPIYVSVLKP